MNATDQKPFAEWIGRESESSDVISERLVRSFRAIFEPHLAPLPDSSAPLGIHWCLSPSIVGMAQLGIDGHPAKNQTMPLVPLPRRMWAGGELLISDAFQVGDEVRRVSTIRDIVRKQGRSGELFFVVVDHAYYTVRGLALRERHDIVYREAIVPPKNPASVKSSVEPAPIGSAGKSWRLFPSSTLLFRYSALSFNGHRIHYDFPYATQVEGYEGLVVHGPLQATLLLNFAAAQGTGVPKTFRYRGVAPAIANRHLAVETVIEGQRLCIRGESGIVHMEAVVDRNLAE